MADCACGHTHFATNHDGQGHYDENELGRLRKMMEKHPDLYTEYPDCDAVHVATFRGVNYEWIAPVGDWQRLKRTCGASKTFYFNITGCESTGKRKRRQRPKKC